MNYELLWNNLKLHYSNRLEKLEGKKSNPLYISAKQTILVMHHFEKNIDKLEIEENKRFLIELSKEM